MRIAVVGGGISGLAAAWSLANHPEAEVTIFEPERVGGKLQTSEFAGRPVDEGADAFLTRTPEALDLCREIGLDTLTAPAAGRTLLWIDGRLKPLPEGLVLGVPGRLAPIATSGLLSPAGMLRAGLDLVMPRRSTGTDLSVGELVRGRFGNEVAVRLVEPLIGGIHAAPLDLLSAESTAPQLLAAARSSRSLLLGLRRQAGSSSGGGGSPFLAPAGGMGRLVRQLVEALTSRGVEVRADRVEAAREGDHGIDLELSRGDVERYDGVVLAIPAPRAAGVLGPLAPPGLGKIEFTSVAILTLAIRTTDWSPPAGFNGFLVPTPKRGLMTACSFFSNKWPEDGSSDQTVVRVSAGTFTDRRVDSLADSDLTDRLVEELSRAIRVTVNPVATRISRWPSSFPLYRVGHAELVLTIEEALDRKTRRMTLAGSSYGGAGVPACIRSGRRAADSLVARLAA